MDKLYPKCDRKDCFANIFQSGFRRCSCLVDNIFDGDCPFFKTCDEHVEELSESVIALQKVGLIDKAMSNMRVLKDFKDAHGMV